jgi:hypothetical protein
MPVFQIRTLYSDNHRVMDIIGETFDAIEALEITPNHWLIIGTPEAAQATFERLKAGLPRDVLNMTELSKRDLINQGRLSNDEISFYRSQARD